MDPLRVKRTRKDGPEAKIQYEVIAFLRNEGWFVKETQGNMYMSGWPDIFACHSTYGLRWIEIKLPNMEGSRFTAAQLEDFPKFCANGAGVWIMTAATHHEYSVLFGPANWFSFIKL